MLQQLEQEHFNEYYSRQNVVEIEKLPLLRANSLKEITIPQSVTSIGADAFLHCGNLTAINIKGTANRISGAPWGAQYGNRAINWNV